MRKWRIVGRICGMKYKRKGHKDRNKHKNEINPKRKVWASSVGLYERQKPQHRHLVKAQVGCCYTTAPQWGAVDAEIKVPCGENTELKRSPFKAWSRLVYSHTCYAYCQGFLSCLFLHFRSIHLHFIPKPLPIFPCVGCD